MFLVIDLAFFSANVLKIAEGRMVPARCSARACSSLMSTWKRGRDLLESRLDADAIPLDTFIASASLGCSTVPGTAVFMTSNLDGVPHPLLHSLKHYKSLHEQVVLLNAVTLDVPHVPERQRVVVTRINPQFRKVKVFFGFMDTPDLPVALEWCEEQGLCLDPMDTSFFLGRETLIPKLGPTWRSGGRRSSSRCSATPATPPPISCCRPIAWSNWAHRWCSDALGGGASA